MKIKDQVPSDNVDDNPSGWKSQLKSFLAPRQTYKSEPSDAVQSTNQHSNKFEKSSLDYQRVNRQGKGGSKRITSGGGGGW